MSVSGRLEKFPKPIGGVRLGSKGAVPHEPCARLVARMFTFWAKRVA
ncbi:hypothetical protein GHK38_22640 [Sinorhizobium meliloti]|nr:hypothetical protein [Sinorhizobium meliloti]MQV42332.1 hypothetical protein [Sinorhizobium meliloti]MQX42985.1 hypothetical protein [Sinorhizobium meliloti]